MYMDQLTGWSVIVIIVRHIYYMHMFFRGRKKRKNGGNMRLSSMYVRASLEDATTAMLYRTVLQL